MSLVESQRVVVAFRSIEGEFGGTEVLEGTQEQIAALKILLIESWRGMGTEGESIVYEGDSLQEARAAIGGLQSVDEEVIRFR